jgi:hypothetical protein
MGTSQAILQPYDLHDAGVKYAREAAAALWLFWLPLSLILDFMNSAPCHVRKTAMPSLSCCNARFGTFDSAAPQKLRTTPTRFLHGESEPTSILDDLSWVVRIETSDVSGRAEIEPL